MLIVAAMLRGVGLDAVCNYAGILTGLAAVLIVITPIKKTTPL